MDRLCQFRKADEDKRKDRNRLSPRSRTTKIPHAAILEKLTKDLALEDKKGPDIDTQLAELVRKLLRDAKPNETKLNELKKKYIVRACRKRGNTSIWNNSGATARSNDLKLQKGQKISCQRYDCCCYSKLIGKYPLPRYSETWDVSVVLHYLQGLSEGRYQK